MKATAPPLLEVVAGEKSWVTVLCDLFKARLTGLVLLTTVAGFYLGSSETLDYGLLFQTVAGTALLASGASALNQLLEWGCDAKMLRTQQRPLPSGRLQPQTVLTLGCALVGLGLFVLGLGVNLVACLVGAVTVSCYLFIYTPLKRKTWLNTLVGAIPGALPPVIGWTAAQGRLTPEAVALFAIQAFWQIPHFMAIAWLYREDYARAGFKMLPVVEPDGRRTAQHAVLFSLLLLPVGLMPFFLAVSGRTYAAAALVLGITFLCCAVRFSSRLSPSTARMLFLVSVLYLPLVFAVMVLDKSTL
jgi:protoheme IX farnesyltransferase